jgi:hypothetical protein
MVEAGRAKSLDYATMILPEATRKFYNDYSKFVLHELRELGVRLFLRKVIVEQGIDRSKVEAVNVVIYPLGSSEGEVTYANSRGIDLVKDRCCGLYSPLLKRIDIYPPRFPLRLTEVTTAKQIWSKEALRYFLFRFEPVRTLIHEYLHVKHKSETVVERLSRKYMIKFEEETTGQVMYSFKRSRLSIWRELFSIAHNDHVF